VPRPDNQEKAVTCQSLYKCFQLRLPFWLKHFIGKTIYQMWNRRGEMVSVQNRKGRLHAFQYASLYRGREAKFIKFSRARQQTVS
jgi:hypothetical protein